MRGWLVACVTAEMVALGCWVGGLTVLVAAAIPAVFNTFGGQDAGGLFLTRVFEGYNRLVLGAIVILVGGALWRQVAPGRQWPWLKPTRIEWAVLAGMVVIAGVIIFGLHPVAATRQAEAFAIKETGARKAALEAFFKIHQPTRVLYLLNLVLGVVLLGAKVRPWVTRSEATT